MTCEVLTTKARQYRGDVVRMIYNSDIRSGHFGGSLSSAEIVAALYNGIMRFDPQNPAKPDRDRLVLSKGHSVPVVYAALADKGFFPKEVLNTYRDQGSILQGHPDARKTPGLDSSAGSLGQGLSVALGQALAARFIGSYKVYALLSDGEMQEGMIWEAAMAAGQYKVSNLVAIVDANGLQVAGRVEEIMNIEPLDEKFRAFGWSAVMVDGHDAMAVYEALVNAGTDAAPTAVICKTVKGKGVSFMENSIEWHCRNITEDEFRMAITEIEQG